MTTGTTRAKCRSHSKPIHGAYPVRRVVMVYQPHRYTRTRDLCTSVAVLSTGDVLLLWRYMPPVRRRSPAPTAARWHAPSRSRGRLEPVFVEHLADLAQSLAAIVQDGDVVITLGAGSIGQAASSLAAQLREAA